MLKTIFAHLKLGFENELKLQIKICSTLGKYSQHEKAK